MRRNRVPIVLGAAILGILSLASLAHADVRTTVYQDVFGPASSRVFWIFNWNYRAEDTSPTTCPCVGRFGAAQNFIGANFTSPAAAPWINVNSRQTATRGQLPPLANNCVPVAPSVKFQGVNAFDHIIQSVGVTTDGAGLVTVTSFSIAIGNVIAGGLGTQALSDTVFAKDSMSVRISKAAGAVTLNNFGGEMRNNPGLSGESVSNAFSVAVYPDSNAANADVDGSGAGSVFFGRVVVTQFGTVLAGGFVAGDFNSVKNPDGSSVVTPRSGLSKTVAVSDLQAATVVVITDPQPSRRPSSTAIHKTVPISAAQEVPPSGTAGTGVAQITINTQANTLSYDITYSGLSSTETAAHIHGFAGPGTNAGVLIGLPATNPKIGTWTYSEAQEANILAGLTYINIHTSNFPSGEIRGQINSPNVAPGSPPVATTALASVLLVAGALWMVARRRRAPA